MEQVHKTLQQYFYNKREENHISIYHKNFKILMPGNSKCREEVCLCSFYMMLKEHASCQSMLMLRFHPGFPPCSPAFWGPPLGLLFLLSFGPWAFNRLTSFVKSQINSALNIPFAVHYHWLVIQGSAKDLSSADMETATIGLQFSTLATDTEPSWF